MLTKLKIFVNWITEVSSDNKTWQKRYCLNNSSLHFTTLKGWYKKEQANIHSTCFYGAIYRYFFHFLSWRYQATLSLYTTQYCSSVWLYEIVKVHYLLLQRAVMVPSPPLSAVTSSISELLPGTTVTPVTFSNVSVPSQVAWPADQDIDSWYFWDDNFSQ